MVNPRFHGLDSLRFVAALWVMMGHGAVPPLTDGHDPSNKLAWALNGFWSASISGPAAVIVFFVISGFCIHLPYEFGKPFRLAEFWARRWVRILIPMLVALLLYRRLYGVSESDDPLVGVPAWSLICELIYYGLYPLLLWLSRKISFHRQFVIAFIVAFAFALTKPVTNVNYPAWGYSLDWILGLPCWYLGVLLAQQVREKRQAPGHWAIWRYRLTAVAIGAITHNLALQQILGQHLTLNFFALFVFVWLKQELAFYQNERRPWPVLEWAGTFSYSLYLIHGIAFTLFHGWPLPMLGVNANWLLVVSWVLMLSWVFYVLVERPSHRVARWLGCRFSGRQ